jgi:hypothetical protein
MGQTPGFIAGRTETILQTHVLESLYLAIYFIIHSVVSTIVSCRSYEYSTVPTGYKIIYSQRNPLT